MKLLLIENADQDRHGIDTVIMVAPDDFDQDEALESSGLARPSLVGVMSLDELIYSDLIALGEYRGFMG